MISDAVLNLSSNIYYQLRLKGKKIKTFLMNLLQAKESRQKFLDAIMEQNPEEKEHVDPETSVAVPEETEKEEEELMAEPPPSEKTSKLMQIGLAPLVR